MPAIELHVTGDGEYVLYGEKGSVYCEKPLEVLLEIVTWLGEVAAVKETLIVGADDGEVREMYEVRESKMKSALRSRRAKKGEKLDV